VSGLDILPSMRSHLWERDNMVEWYASRVGPFNWWIYWFETKLTDPTIPLKYFNVLKPLGFILTDPGSPSLLRSPIDSPNRIWVGYFPLIFVPQIFLWVLGLPFSDIFSLDFWIFVWHQSIIPAITFLKIRPHGS